METLKTKITKYRFDMREPEQKREYEALRERLKDWPHCMTAFGAYYDTAERIGRREVELETKHLFDNQWNSAPIEGVSEKGLRLFDWAETPHGLGIVNPRAAPAWERRGYYLDQTPEMREIRRNTARCGYCGKQEPAAKGYVFCPHCIDSEYLEEKDLKLTRMRPCDAGFGYESPKLTQAERAHLLPLFKEAQLHSTTARGKKRIADQRASLSKSLASRTKHAQAEHDGMLWLLDHGLKIDNVIYYNHTGRFGFGWQKLISADVLSELLDVISEFRFPYDIKCADGRTLSGN